MSTSLNVVKSASLLLGIQVIQRGLGLISTLILARLLAPADFGVIALITIGLQFSELLVETGNQQYIIQKEAVGPEDLNTAWTLDILSKGFIAVMIIVSAPALSGFFETPELLLALPVAALALPIRALKTPGIMMLARDINYRSVFRLSIVQKCVSFIVVISFAFIRGDYWAIVIGNLAGAIVFAVGSYRIHSFRPNWSLRHLRTQWQFSQWLLLRGIVGFTRSQVDTLMVSKVFGTAQLGGYNLVREVSLLPALSAFIPMCEPLLAAVSQVRSSREVLAYRVRLASALLISLLIPFTVYIMSYPNLIVEVLLGPQWRDYADLLQPFGLFFFTFTLFALLSDTVIALGRVKALFVFDVVSTIIIAALLYHFGTTGLGSMAWTRGWLAVGTTAALLLLINYWSPLNLPRLFYLCIPSLLGTAVSLYLIQAVPIDDLPAVARFLLSGSLFVLFAIATSVGLGLILLRNTEEWTQIEGLVRNILSKRLR
ncbi:polysaccharide biosynthesis protein [Marinobacter santoriniensis NKSG1]|uniref:Polysaccharide biosynthesis protein n=1 Tax=Marinobacter santoriniensis NKSG1 TaxID=1288826 RepID=M7D4A3_9GAMM|nr:oligosaccharide flippase family protein [Marinobacter santoriniensis]EMP55568.1 polysaccharide biosynthesis protein [Marinobacter santoriniensis NKSG1]